MSQQKRRQDNLKTLLKLEASGENWNSLDKVKQCHIRVSLECFDLKLRTKFALYELTNLMRVVITLNVPQDVIIKALGKETPGRKLAAEYADNIIDPVQLANFLTIYQQCGFAKANLPSQIKAFVNFTVEKYMMYTADLINLLCVLQQLDLLDRTTIINAFPMALHCYSPQDQKAYKYFMAYIDSISTHSALRATRPNQMTEWVRNEIAIQSTNLLKNTLGSKRQEGVWLPLPGKILSSINDEIVKSCSKKQGDIWLPYHWLNIFINREPTIDAADDLYAGILPTMSGRAIRIDCCLEDNIEDCVNFVVTTILDILSPSRTLTPTPFALPANVPVAQEIITPAYSMSRERGFFSAQYDTEPLSTYEQFPYYMPYPQ